jgi:hypothetical protein
MHKDYFGNHIAKMHYVGHFFVLMIKKEIDLTTLEIMHYIFCYNSLILNLNPKI